MISIPFFIARRYLFSKKSTQAINIIAWVSLLGFAIGVFAMIVVLSTMNGFEKLVFGMYNDFSPDIKSFPTSGKVMNINPSLESFLDKKGIQYSRTLEENAACYYSDFQHIARIKGVEPSFNASSRMDEHLVNGMKSEFTDTDSAFAMIGLGVDYKLATRVEDPNCWIEVNAPRRGNFSIGSMESVNQRVLKPIGVFAYDDAINNQYVLVNLSFAQDLFERPNQISSYEIAVDEKNRDEFLEQLRINFGKEMIFKTRYELHESLFKMFKSEKWFTFMILAFVLLLVSFNLTGSLSLLVIEKKKDIKILKSMGVTMRKVRRIFFLEGFFVTVLGSAIGVILGLVFTISQMKFGFIKISGAIVESYPMQVKWLDVILCWILVLTIGVLASVYPALKAGRYHE